MRPCRMRNAFSEQFYEMPYTIKTARKSGKYSLSKLCQERDNEEEALAGLNEMIRMGWRCSTELYAEMLMAVK